MNMIYQEMKKVIIIIIVIGLIGFVFWFGYNLSPGIYPYAEYYEVEISQEKLIETIKLFKHENPQYNVPLAGLKDWDLDTLVHRYHFYFYYPNENQIIHCFVRPAGINKTTFAFDAIRNGLSFSNGGDWQDINKDFSRSESKEQKKMFEERILNRIKDMIK
jgi:hypothetical protein